MRDAVRERAIWTIIKYKDAQAFWLDEPYEVIHLLGNLLLNEGINYLWYLVCGNDYYYALDHEHALIGVGTSVTGIVASQTGLQGASQLYKAVEESYPIFGTDQKAVFKAVFDEDEANFAWNEFALSNGAIVVNRRVDAQGTKPVGQVWSVTLEIGFS